MSFHVSHFLSVKHLFAQSFYMIIFKLKLLDSDAVVSVYVSGYSSLLQHSA